MYSGKFREYNAHRWSDPLVYKSWFHGNVGLERVLRGHLVHPTVLIQDQVCLDHPWQAFVLLCP